MNKQYTISGMTCEKCKQSVAEQLIAIAEVDSVIVNLKEGTADLQSKKKISIEKLQAGLGKSYQISDPLEGSGNFPQVSKWKQLKPLFLIFGYLIAATLYLQPSEGDIAMFMRHFMGLFFIIFSFFKFLDYQGFPDSFARYDPLAKKSRAYAFAYPFIETLLGIAFLMEWGLLQSLIATLVILSFTTYGVINALIRKSNIECACLGTALKLPMTEATLIENSIMIVMAISMLAGYFI